MTLARSPKEVPFFSVSTDLFPTAQKPLVAMLYPVTLHKVGGKWNEFKLGFVVTHLDLQDWCAMKGYRLVAPHKGSRPALPHERTDLF